LPDCGEARDDRRETAGKGREWRQKSCGGG